MQVRRLNATGVRRFRGLLEALRSGELPSISPEEILTSPNTSSGLNVALHVEDGREITSKMDMARYLYEVLTPLNREDTLRRVGLWSWLGLFMFDTICPVDPNTGTRRIREDWYYVFQPDDAAPNYQTYYRHLLYTPYFIYRTFGGRAGRALLAGRADVGGDMIEQIASRQEYISCRSVLETLDHLYYTEENRSGRVKRGATDRTRDGSLRRFVAFLQQIDATYDLYGMSREKIVDVLPPEFDEWQL